MTTDICCHIYLAFCGAPCEAAAAALHDALIEAGAPTRLIRLAAKMHARLRSGPILRPRAPWCGARARRLWQRWITPDLGAGSDRSA